jgi:hypothetical protein
LRLVLFIRVVRDIDQFVTLDGFLLIAPAGSADGIEELVVCDSGLELRGGGYVVEK